MAMRLYSNADFIRELADLGFKATETVTNGGRQRLFISASGKAVIFPNAESYPDYLWDDIMAHALAANKSGGDVVHEQSYSVADKAKSVPFRKR